MSKEIKDLSLKESENFRDRLINLVSKLPQFGLGPGHSGEAKPSRSKCAWLGEHFNGN